MACSCQNKNNSINQQQKPSTTSNTNKNSFVKKTLISSLINSNIKKK